MQAGGISEIIEQTSASPTLVHSMLSLSVVFPSYIAVNMAHCATFVLLPRSHLPHNILHIHFVTYFINGILISGPSKQ